MMLRLNTTKLALIMVALFMASAVLASPVMGQKSSGTFVRTDVNGRGEVKIKVKKTSLTFDMLALGKQKGTCVGEIKGEAIFINATTAEFNPNGEVKDTVSGEPMSCQLIFIFLSKSRVKVLEKSCDDNHGAACTFQGTYRKQK